MTDEKYQEQQRLSPIKIKDLERIAKQHDLQCLVTVAVDRDGAVSVVSYGEDKRKCQSIGIWALGLWQHAISIHPFKTIFGWGNDGHPSDYQKEMRCNNVCCIDKPD